MQFLPRWFCARWVAKKEKPMPNGLEQFEIFPPRKMSALRGRKNSRDIGKFDTRWKIYRIVFFSAKSWSKLFLLLFFHSENIKPCAVLNWLLPRCFRNKTDGSANFADPTEFKFPALRGTTSVENIRCRIKNRRWHFTEFYHVILIFFATIAKAATALPKIEMKT